MAGLTRSSHLAHVDVRVAIRTAGTGVPEVEVCVTTVAGDLLVQSAEGVARLQMHKIRRGAQRPPARCRVAILARDGQITVRAPRRPAHDRLSGAAGGADTQPKYNERGRHRCSQPSAVMFSIWPEHAHRSPYS
jgi:hypothetical protein